MLSASLIQISYPMHTEWNCYYSWTLLLSSPKTCTIVKYLQQVTENFHFITVSLYSNAFDLKLYTN